ncbi:Hermansky-Pudlak syndrome 1 protein homolog [Schistocerca gregaria]|uniref:Hermansky-Pudlak syndrome 1 protein homolog n=1 Tax=Schistocerca gregaria TaxID=7010 RepID=UPI00211E58BB|nr:Hermansky-Pudlak syndrome 1 protein homolog [Schistocerca gregaria]
MRCILIFDQLSDILYTKYDRKFLKHLKKLATQQGLIREGKDEDEISPNIIIQIFSPIVASQRIMGCQFGNSYTSIQCQDGTNMVFDEYMGYLFVHIGLKNVTWLKRMLGICITVVKHLCGPDVSILKSNKSRAALLSRLLDTWTLLQDTDQAVLVEAVEQLMVNVDLSSATLRTLQEATEKLKTCPDFSKLHTMILVENKFLSLYSSRNAQDLSPHDIIFLSLLCEAHYMMPSGTRPSEATESDSSEEFYSPAGSPRDSPHHTKKQLATSLTVSVDMFDGSCEQDVLNTQLVLLTGGCSVYTPHIVHITSVEDGVYLLFIIETHGASVASGLCEAFGAINELQNVQLQKDIDELRHSFDNLDSSIKKILEGYKKLRSSKHEIEISYKKLTSKWDFLRKKYIEYIKTQDSECILRIESSTASFIDVLKEMLQLTCWDTSLIHQGKELLLTVANHVKQKLSHFSEFLKVKALRNFTLGSRASLTINKYLEEFPGLVHFLYIDRTNHRITAPGLDFSSEETITLTKKKIWSMVDFSRAHLQEGHLAIMWKDTTFNYAYFLWFEDASGAPLKPKSFQPSALKSLPVPGVLCGDFYKNLMELSFPKTSPSKIRCFELYCIHLGLATSSCVLEHSRRLAATIWEVTGLPNNPLDIL